MTTLTDARWLRGHVVPVLIGAVLGIGGLAAVMLVLVHLAFPRPADHHNPSFRYGEKVLDSIYGTAQGSVTEACKTAITRRSDHPKPFDLGQAVAGCKYQEWVYDN